MSMNGLSSVASHNQTGTSGKGSSVLNASDVFAPRHIAPSLGELQEMLSLVGYSNLETFTDALVPESIRNRSRMNLPEALGENDALNLLRKHAGQNRTMRSMIGMGYYDTITPPVILRNIIENPGWYTQYTPYQAEIAQGRLEALLNFQTMVSDLTGLPLAGASLLDEGTAAAEAMAMCVSIHDHSRLAFVVAEDVHPQTIAVMRTRAESMGIELRVCPSGAMKLQDDVCGLLVQYPNTDGVVDCYKDLCARAKGMGIVPVVATDLLALTMLNPPGAWGAEVVVGSAQRFGVPMGYGGPHAAFIATKVEHSRKLPGRIIGVSRDATGKPALRMAIQTREQHIKREKATSNICTAQALLAICASMYGVYHGPEGLLRIANRVHAYTQCIRAALTKLGHQIDNEALVFDTLKVKVVGRSANDVLKAAVARGINLRNFGDGHVGISCDETTDRACVQDLLAAFGGADNTDIDALLATVNTKMPPVFARQTGYMTHPVFNTHHSEHEMLRYIFKLMGRDLSLAQSMISLGSCTMKLNATSEMIPVTWPEFGRLHPFAPLDQTKGYAQVFKDLETWLAEITGFDAVSLQPNAGSQGEYAGLLVIRAYHHSRKDFHRNICLIPDSAHGTNPASAVIAGMKVVAVKNTPSGDIDIDDLKIKIEANKANLAALMVTYPSTYGVFEAKIKEICQMVHDAGGQVYMDGANMNAQVGLTSPGMIGADVCHLNLHKTFCIPHGGGGPGMGPICMKKHLAPFMAGHPVTSPFAHQSEVNNKASGGTKAGGPVSAAPWGSPSILLISWMYIAMMGPDGLRRATQVACLNANYMAKRLEKHYPILFRGQNGLAAHEFILDTRVAGPKAGVTVDDIAKRLQDYGFHGPTMSWPVAGTLMIEPTESEPKSELDRFCDAMIGIANEIEEIASGKADKASNVLKHAPHPLSVIASDEWTRPYTREKAAYPAAWLRDQKFWPPVGRVDNPYGDRNLVCICPPVSEYAQS